MINGSTHKRRTEEEKFMANLYKFTLFTIKHCDATPSKKDKAFYALMEIKENAKKLGVKKFGNLELLKEEDFENFNYSHKVEGCSVYTVNNKKEFSSRKYFIPMDLMIEKTEGWNMFVNRVNKYNEKLALQ